MSAVVNGMRPIHPGEILREEFLMPLGITPHALALALRVSAPRVNDIVRERRSVTADTALRLSRFFGTTAEFWMGLQTDYDMAITRPAIAEALACIQRFEAAP
ncbi:MAG: HigA family addiction module antitoxin [Lautropia sp.]